MEERFTSLKALYKRLLPAIKTKHSEMILSGFSYVSKEDIFNYVQKKTWKDTKEITLYEMVSDILNADCYDIVAFLGKKVKQEKKEIVKEDKTLL